MEKVGTTLKTISMYLRSSKTEAEEAGISTDGMADSVSKLREEILSLTGGQVDIQIDEDTFKSSYDILKEISEVWDQLTDVSQANILEKLGGKRNANVVAALIENMDIAERAMQTSADSAGSALKENEKYLDSIEGKISQFKSSFQALGMDFIGSDFIKGIVMAGTKLMDLLDILSKVGSKLGGLSSVFGVLVTGAVGKGLVKDLGALFGKTALSKSVIPFFKDLPTNMKNMGSGFITVFNNAKESGDGFFKSVNKGMKASKMAGGSLASALNAVNLAMLGVGAGIAIYQHVKEKQEETRQSAIESAQAYSDNAAQIDQFKARAAVLRESLSSGNLSTSEAVAARQELVSMQETLISTYGREAESINLVTGALDQQSAAMDALTQKNFNQFMAENNKTVNDVNKKFTDYMDGQSNFTYTAASGSLPDAKDLERGFKKGFSGSVKEFYADLQSELEQLDLDVKFTAVGEDGIKMEGAKDVYDYLEAQKAMYETIGSVAQKYFGNDYQEYVGPALNHWSNMINETQGYVDDNYDVFKSYSEGILSTSSEYKNLWSEALAAQQEYQTAMEKGDKEGMESAATRIKSVREALNKGMAEGGNLQDSSANLYFDEMLKGLEDQMKDIDLEIEVRAKLSNDSDFKSSIEDAVKTLSDENGVLSSEALDNVKYTYDSKIEHGITALTEQEKAYATLKAAADEYGAEVEDLYPILTELGIITASVTDTMTSNYEKIASKASEISANMETVNTAFSEISENGAMSAATYKNLISLGKDYSDALEWNGNTLTLNRDKIKALNKEMAENAKQSAKTEQAVSQNKWAQNAAEILRLQKAYSQMSDAEREADAESGKNTLKRLEALEAENRQIADNISKYQQLISQLDYMTSGYKAWQDAQSMTEQGQMLDDATQAYKTLEDGFKTGLIGTNKFKGAEDFLVPQDVLDKGVDATRKYVNSIKNLFNEDLGTKRFNKFMNDSVKQGLASWGKDGSWTINPDIKTDDFVKKLHMTEDVVLAVFGKLNDYGFDISFGDEDPTAALRTVQGLIDAQAKLRQLESQGVSVDSEQYVNAAKDVQEYAEQLRQLPDEQLTKIGVVRANDDSLAKFKSEIESNVGDSQIDLEARMNVKWADGSSPESLKLQTKEMQLGEQKVAIKVTPVYEGGEMSEQELQKYVEEHVAGANSVEELLANDDKKVIVSVDTEYDLKNEQSSDELANQASENYSNVKSAIENGEEFALDPITIETEVQYRTKSDVQSLIESYRTTWDQLQAAIKNGEDTLELSSDLQNIRAQLEALPEEVKIAFGIDTSLFDSGIASVSETISDYQAKVAELQRMEAANKLNTGTYSTEQINTVKDEIDSLYQKIEKVPDIEIQAHVEKGDLDTFLKNPTAGALTPQNALGKALSVGVNWAKQQAA